MTTNNQFDPAAHVYEDRTTTWSCVGRDVSECTDFARSGRKGGGRRCRLATSGARLQQC